MNVLRGVGPALVGERVLRIEPPLGPYVVREDQASPPRKRPHFFAGRSLGHVALTDAQRQRMDLGARLARGVAPGVFAGLEVSVQGDDVLILPGQGVSVHGEDVELAHATQLAARSIDLLGISFARGFDETNAADRALRDALASGEPLNWALVQAAGRIAELPHALVLVAQPVTVLIAAEEAGASPCPNALDDAALARYAWEDGFRLVWVAWPGDSALPAWTEDGSTLSPKFRNRLAHRIFAAEAARGATGAQTSLRRWRTVPGARPLPYENRAEAATWSWDAVGVPLALVGFDQDHRPAFADRNSVVRQGGGSRSRSASVAGAPDAALAAARIAQWHEHLAELPPAQQGIKSLVQQFETLPPAGILPRAAATLETGRQHIFPAFWEVQAQPVTLDMVDGLLAESAPLAPFRLSQRDQVQLLVPVPARVFDPDLLKLDERVNPLFDSEIARLAAVRAALLSARDPLQQRVSVLAKSIAGRYPDAPPQDPDGLPDESGLADSMTRTRRVGTAPGQTAEHGFVGAHATLEFGAADALVFYVRITRNPVALALRARVAGSTVEGPVLVWGEQVLVNSLVQGALPAAGRWQRLVVSADAAGIAGRNIDGLRFIQVSGRTASELSWGYAGRLSQGRETVWLGDALPPGASEIGGTLVQWLDSAPVDPALDAARGLSLEGPTRRVDPIAQLLSSYRSYRGGALLGELGETGDQAAAARRRTNPRVLDAGLDELIARLQHRIDAANDHVEIGFLRARSDIFRIRQSLLGNEEAGRLLTSPTAAELVTRSDTPVATDKDFADYFRRAQTTAVAREPVTPPRDTSLSSATFAVRSEAFIAFDSRLAETRFRSVADTTKVEAFGIQQADDSLVTSRSSEFVKTATLTEAKLPSTADIAGSSLYSATVESLTVGERIKGAPAIVASNAAAKGKADFVAGSVSLLDLQGLAIDDIEVPGYTRLSGAAEGPITIAALREDLVREQRLFTDAETLPGGDLHEADYFRRGVDATDNLIRFLRQIELRGEDYRRLRTDAVAARARLQAAMQQLRSDIAALDARLAEVRHDLTVTRTLRSEEEQRLAALVQRRREILATEVPYLVFRRPRLSDATLGVPTLAVQPALIDDPVPRCREQTHEAPAALRQMVGTLRELPARLLKIAPPLIERFDQLDALRGLAQTLETRLRAEPAARAPQRVQTDSPVSRAISGLVERGVQREVSVREAARPAIARLDTSSWAEVASTLRPHLSLGDLIRTPSAPREVTLAAAGELDDILGVASCLHRALGEVPAATRLRWAQLLSEFDAARELRLLSVLPGFGDEGLDLIAWRQMQRMVDWLYARIVPEADAVAAISDLVRVCVLLAAHAPVRRIVLARIARPLVPTPGARLELELDLSDVRIGAQVLVHHPVSSQLVARAVIDDLGAGGAAARITAVLQVGVTLDRGSQVQLEPVAAQPPAAVRVATTRAGA